jgi:Papain-like cysteine protease AvrRpt2
MERRDFFKRASQFGLMLGIQAYAGTLFADLRCTQFVPPGVQTCEAGIESSILDAQVLDSVQHRSEWCWAACIAMVFDYYRHPVAQERIVQQTWGSIVNVPGQPGQIIADLNRPWVDARGQHFHASGDVYSVNAITAAQDLAANHPLIIGSLGHAMVLTDLVYLRDAYGRGQPQQAVVRDPWPGRGRRQLTPQEWYAIQFAARIRVS